MKILNLLLMVSLAAFLNCALGQNLWDTFDPVEPVFQVVETTPVDGQEISSAYNIIVFFNGILNPASLTDDPIIVFDVSSDPPIKITGRLVIDNIDPRSITFIPDTLLQESNYSLVIKSSIEDLNNNSLESIVVINFTVNSEIMAIPEVKKILPEISSKVRSSSKFKVFFTIGMNTSPYTFTITQEGFPLASISHNWVVDDFGNGVIFKFEPDSPSPGEFDPGAKIDVVLEDFTSIGPPSLLLDPNPYKFAFYVEEE